MATFIGYYSPDEAWLAETNAKARTDGPTGFDPTFLERVAALPDQLPSGCKIVGAYASRGLSSATPSIMVVETDNDDDLTFIGNYYQGFLQFLWVPAIAIGGTRAARDEWIAATQAQIPEQLRA